MTSGLIAVRENADYKDIVTTLRRFRVSACPVVDDADRPIGVVSEADLYKEIDQEYPPNSDRREKRPGDGDKAAAITAGQLMTAPVTAIHPGAPVAEAARLMQDNQIKRLAVVGQGGWLVGIVTRSDVLSAYELPDAAIRDEIGESIIDDEFALNRDQFEVAVRSGIVTISGVVERRDTAVNLLARIRHAQGVVSVRDRLTYPARENLAPRTW